MILSDGDIKKALASGRIVVEPKPDLAKQLGSCSLDLRLGEHITKLRTKGSEIQVRDQKIVLPPGEFCLGMTMEHIKLSDDLCGMIHGRSSLGRKGLAIHSTAPLFDAGFRGHPVLELFNSGPEPISLSIGMRVCAFTFEELTSPAEVPYYKKKGAKYIDQEKP